MMGKEKAMKKSKKWSRDWKNFDWNKVREKLCEIEEMNREGKPVDKFDIGISLDEIEEYFDWLYESDSDKYFETILLIQLVRAGIPQKEAQILVKHPEELKKAMEDLL